MSRYRFFALPRAALLSLLFVCPPLSAQVVAEPPLSEALEIEREATPPVPAGLHAETDGASVSLSWQPCDEQERNVVLRHTEPITSLNYTQAEAIAELAAGEAAFVDYPEGARALYYAIAPRDAETGELKPFFVPAENSLLFPVEIAAAEGSSEEKITFFDVVLKNQAVVISWETEPYGRDVIIYRSTHPFESRNALAGAAIIAAGEEAAQPYVDYPVPGVPYYYAVIPESTVRSGTVAFSYGENTNEIPVEVPGEYAGVSRTARSAVRDIPLPRLNPAGATQAPAASFSAETEQAIASLTSQAARRQAGSREASDAAYRFPEDSSGAAGGEEAALKSILDSNFESENWEGLKADLLRFLSLRRTNEVAARARFYLGEACYFTGDYSQALEEFLLARGAYPAKCAEWIQKTLKKL